MSVEIAVSIQLLIENGQEYFSAFQFKFVALNTFINSIGIRNKCETLYVWQFVCVPVYFDGARMQTKTMIEQIGVCHARRA